MAAILSVPPSYRWSRVLLRRRMSRSLRLPQAGSWAWRAARGSRAEAVEGRAGVEGQARRREGAWVCPGVNTYPGSSAVVCVVHKMEFLQVGRNKKQGNKTKHRECYFIWESARDRKCFLRMMCLSPAPDLPSAAPPEPLFGAASPEDPEGSGQTHKGSWLLSAGLCWTSWADRTAEPASHSPEIWRETDLKRTKQNKKHLNNTLRPEIH